MVANKIGPPMNGECVVYKLRLRLCTRYLVFFAVSTGRVIATVQQRISSYIKISGLS